MTKSSILYLHSPGVQPKVIVRPSGHPLIQDSLTCCTGSLVLEVIFGSPDNFRSEELIFDIAPFRSGYHALLRRAALARFNAVPNYAYLKIKMPGPRGVITVSGNTERSLRAEEYVAALAAEH